MNDEKPRGVLLYIRSRTVASFSVPRILKVIVFLCLSLRKCDIISDKGFCFCKGEDKKW